LWFNVLQQPLRISFSFDLQCGVKSNAMKRSIVSLFAMIYFVSCSDNRPHPAIAFHAWGTAGSELGQFTGPRGIAYGDKEIYVVDKSARVQVFRTDGTPLRQWTLPDQTQGTPTTIRIQSDGEVWIPDTHNSRILVYTSQGDFKRTFGSHGREAGQFSFVTDVAHTPDGTFSICEYGFDDRVQQFKEDGTSVRIFGTHGRGPGELSRPMAMVYYPPGRLYVADAANHRIQCFSSEGEFLFLWGERGELPGQFRYPYDLDIDAEGSIYVCEFGNHRIQKFTPEGKYVAQWGMAGTGPGQLFGPWGVAVPPEGGRIFVADTGNHRIAVFEIDGRSDAK